MYKSPIKWLGGKFYMAKKLVALFPEHFCYCEVFGGAGHALLRKKPCRIEVLNDINGELVNFWKVYASNPQYFLKKMEFALYSRQTFLELKHRDITNLSPEERAWRYFYLNRCCYAGMMDRDGGCPRFGISRGTRNGNGNASAFAGMGKRLAETHERIKAVIFECLDWRNCILTYDSANTFFYLDPPYEGHENSYGRNVFARKDYTELASMLKNIKGKFLLSVNDSEFTRSVFSGFEQTNISTIYPPKADTLHHNEENTQYVSELLVANYETESGVKL